MLLHVQAMENYIKNQSPVIILFVPADGRQVVVRTIRISVILNTLLISYCNKSFPKRRNLALAKK
jgi:hypothetical protein